MLIVAHAPRQRPKRTRNLPRLQPRPDLLARAVWLAAVLLLLPGCALVANSRSAPGEEALAGQTQETEPYRILVTNDDGIDSPGLEALALALAEVGEVSIVAPLENQSGIGHALNLRDPIFLARREVAGRTATALSGTPATCVRLALASLLADAPPDLVVSGINRGLNFGRNAYISGTVAAAREAALEGIPAIAVSLAYEAHPDYAQAAAALTEVAIGVKRHGLPATVFLNVNVPAGRPRGLRVSRQSRLVGSESYEARRNPYGRPYFWSVFSQPTAEPEPGSDVAAVGDGWVAVTPLQATESAEEALGFVEEILELTEKAAATPGRER